MYHNIEEIETAITNLATAHPAIAERISLPEESLELHKTISCLRIGSKAAGAVDGALLVFGQHAREWVPPEIALNLMADLISAYTGNHALTYGGRSYTAAQVREIVDNINIFIVPCVNPDGRFFTQSKNDEFHRMWRRNRNTSVHPSPNCQGVDLNRNYDFTFKLDKYFDTTGTAVLSYNSDNPCHGQQVYQGKHAFSEPETRNISWLFDTYPRIRWFVDIHAYKSEIYYPWGDDENQSANAAMNWRNPAFDHQRGGAGDAYSEYISAGDLATHVSLATRLREGIQPVRGLSYNVTQIFSLYPVSGSSTDWVWSRHLTDPSKPRVEAFSIEVAGAESDTAITFGFQPLIPHKDEIVREVTSGLINFCLATVCGVPGLTATLRTSNVVFNRIPEGRVASRPVILQVTGCQGATFRVASGPSRTGGSTNIVFGTAVATRSVAAAATVLTRDLYLWLTVQGGLNGNSATGTVRVECPETSQTWDVPLVADFVRAPRAGAVLVLDRSGSMEDDGGDGRTRLEVLLDSAPAFVELAPPNTRVGLVRFATDESPGAPMTTFGPEGPDTAGRQVIRDAIASHTVATGEDAWTSIGDGVHAGNALIGPVGGLDFKALVVLTDGHENRSRFLSEVSALINDRVFAIGLGTPEEIEPIALNTLTNGTGGYMLMTGTLDADDPYRLAKYYLQILTGVTNNQVVLDPDGWLPFGGTQSIPFYLNEADQSVDTILLIPYPKLVRMRLRTPGGVILDVTSPAVKWTIANQIGFYRFTLPVPGAFSAEGPGRWEILLDWQRNWKQTWDREKRTKLFAATTGRHALRYKALVHTRSELEMAATVGQSSLTPGATVTVRVRLTQYESIPIESAKVRALVRFPDKSEVAFYLNPIAEGVYEVAFTANLSGTYTIRITAEGHSLRGAPFTREAVRTALVWPGGDREPPRSDGDCWCHLIRCLLESKAIDPEVLKRLGVNVKGLLRCCPPEEPEGKFKRQDQSSVTKRAASPSAKKKARQKTLAKRRQN
jgi:murein tripeptide amidase MpaA